ncbi:hypothetical protein QYF36_002457 [Acer negundo]|nr:hypothetical protein QYF36_002457 [Acer negundo]
MGEGGAFFRIPGYLGKDFKEGVYQCAISYSGSLRRSPVGEVFEDLLRTFRTWAGGVDLPPSISPVPSLPPSPSNTAQITTTQPDTVLIPSSTLAKPPAKIPSPLPTPAGLLVRTPTHPSTRAPGHQSIREQLGISEKEAAHVCYPAIDVPLGSGSRGATHNEVVSRFRASCPGRSLVNMAKLPTEILAAKWASVLAKGFKFALAMEKQLLTLKEAYVGLQAKLEDTQHELVQAQQSLAPLLQVAKASEDGRQAAMVEAQRYLCCLDIETVWSLRRRSSFEDGYFVTCYKVATALPPPFDHQAALNKDREQIMAKEEEEEAAGTEVLEVEADKSSLAAKGEENASAGSMVPIIEETQSDTTAEVIREGVASQGENLEEEKNA